MAKDGDKSEWKEYVWNPRTREFLGRTASSWGKYRAATAMQQTCSPGSVTGRCHGGLKIKKNKEILTEADSSVAVQHRQAGRQRVWC